MTAAYLFALFCWTCCAAAAALMSRNTAAWFGAPGWLAWPAGAGAAAAFWVFVPVPA